MLKLGFIGCGGIARYHSNVIRGSVKKIAITAGADTSPRALAQFGEDGGAPELYRDYGEMLKKADIDAVCVALPTGLHKKATIAALRRGKHVFCEKPMAMSLRDCDAMIEAADKAGRVLMIGHVRRYDSDWGAWKKLVLSGAVGRPVLWRQTGGGAGPGRWFMDARMGGGPFLDAFVHNWDFANWMFGRPKEAVGSLMKFGTGTAPDTGAVIVRYESGDEVMLSLSWALPRGVRAASMGDILGPKGAILFPGSYAREDLPREFDAAKYGAYVVDAARGRRCVRFVRRDMFAAEWKDFCGAVREGREPTATGEAGRAAAAVGLAVLEAGKKRKPVRVET